MSGATDERRPERGRNRPTMTDVARIAGVSQSSVSLVLNSMSGARISAETRQRVLDAAQQVGYALPTVRRDAAAGGPKTIAYLVDEISTSPHAVVNLDGARDYAFNQGILVAAHVTRSNPELEEATFAAIARDKSVIGVIYSTIFTRRIRLPRQLDELPAVLLNCHAEPARLPTILPAESAGGFSATASLTALGHRRIGFINGEPWMDAAADRLVGYRRALAAAGIDFDAALLRQGDWLPLSGYMHTLDLMALPEAPTAIFCGNDLMAVGAMEAAAELGLAVPGDLSIIGYDDQELARYTHPPLSTVMLPNYEMGQRAAEALIDWAVHGRRPASGTVRLEGPRVMRGSTAAPRNPSTLKPTHREETHERQRIGAAARRF